MIIELDYDDCATSSWTLTASHEAIGIVAAVCDKDLHKAQNRLDLLLIELGHEIYETAVIGGLLVY